MLGKEKYPDRRRQDLTWRRRSTRGRSALQRSPPKDPTSCRASQGTPCSSSTNHDSPGPTRRRSSPGSWPTSTRRSRTKARDVAFEHYDMPDMTLEGDVHVSGRMKVAWFKGPGGDHPLDRPGAAQIPGGSVDIPLGHEDIVARRESELFSARALQAGNSLLLRRSRCAGSSPLFTLSMVAGAVLAAACTDSPQEPMGRTGPLRYPAEPVRIRFMVCAVFARDPRPGGNGVRRPRRGEQSPAVRRRERGRDPRGGTALGRLGIPSSAYAIEVVEPIHMVATLRDQWRLTQGGIQIQPHSAFPHARLQRR